MTSLAAKLSMEERARASCGGSGEPVKKAAASIVLREHAGRGLLLDIGCGTGEMWTLLRDHFDRYCGVDAVRYERLPPETQFAQVDLNSNRWDVPDAFADVTISVETIEHLENPRAFFREICRVTKPGRLLLVTTPNQISILSKLTLLLKNQFNGFQAAPGLYPAHITALLPIDLLRIAEECGVESVRVDYSGRGRMPGTSLHWPRMLSRNSSLFSDNVILCGLRSERR